MRRRDFVRGAALGAVAASLPGCRPREGPAEDGAPAQTGRRIRWRLASSFPRSTELLFGGAERLARGVSAKTGGRFQIRVHPPGEIVGGLQVLDAVQNRTVEIGHTCGYYYVGKQPALAFETAVPFGMQTRQHNAWMIEGEGLDEIRRILADFNIISFQGGNTGAQMGGWWRREVNSLSDVRGLRVRIPGYGGRVMDRLGAASVVLAGAELYQALERGSIDALEWVGPFDDEKLGFHRIARFYYYPAWWEPTGMISFYVNQRSWESLPGEYQLALEATAAEVNQWMVAAYDAENGPALRRLVEGGT
jgi:TRAP-type mannitol/chloroaromatic compound transport system substrate-binding protein